LAYAFRESYDPHGPFRRQRIELRGDRSSLRRSTPSSMAQIFHPSTNTLAKVSIFGAVFILGAVAVIADKIHRSPYVTQAQVARAQPVPFSHRTHVSALGIDCRYCHTSAEESAFAGIPPTKTCMTCHSQVFTNADMLEPVRESYRTDRPIEWTRVHDLPDFTYFNHSIHLSKGFGCSTCHGAVDEMPLMWREHSLNMEWCLACHREPARFIRPRDAIYDMDWRAPADEPQEVLGPRLVEEHGVRAQGLTNCNICHR